MQQLSNFDECQTQPAMVFSLLREQAGQVQ